ncbi:putative amino acid protein [Ilyonectria robusta]
MTTAEKVPEKSAAESASMDLARTDSGSAPAALDTLKKRYNFTTLITLYVSASATWEGLLASLYQVCIGGGPLVLFWGYMIAAAGAISMATVMSEFASMWPHNAAQYHWSVKLAPPKWRRGVGWTISWSNALVYIFSSVSTNYIAIMSIQGIVTLGVEGYTAPRWQAYLMFLALGTISIVINLFSPRSIHWISIGGFIFHVAGFLVITITLLATAPQFNSAHVVFTQIQDLTGWNNKGLAMLVGMLPVVVGFTGVTVPAYLSEETERPEINVPRSIFLGTIMTAAIGLCFNLSLAFSMGDPMVLLANPVATNSTAAAIILQNTRSLAAAMTLPLFLVVVAAASTIESFTLASRLILGTSRENAMPGGKWLAHLHPRFNTPMRILFILYAIHVCFGTIYVANVTAFYGVTGALSILVMITLLVPTGMHIVLMHKLKLPYGPWKMPDVLRMPVNIIAFLTFSFLFVAMLVPSTYPITAANMNYACAMIGASAVISALTWAFWGRHHYTGEIVIVEGMAVHHNPEEKVHSV